MTCSAHHRLAIEFGESVYEIVGGIGDTVVAREINYSQVLGDIVFCKEFPGFACRSAAEQYIKPL